jgi:hypothetical protein
VSSLFLHIIILEFQLQYLNLIIKFHVLSKELIEDTSKSLVNSPLHYSLPSLSLCSKLICIHVTLPILNICEWQSDTSNLTLLFSDTSFRMHDYYSRHTRRKLFTLITLFFTKVNDILTGTVCWHVTTCSLVKFYLCVKNLLPPPSVSEAKPSKKAVVNRWLAKPFCIQLPHANVWQGISVLISLQRRLVLIFVI